MHGPESTLLEREMERERERERESEGEREGERETHTHTPKARPPFFFVVPVGVPHAAI